MRVGKNNINADCKLRGQIISTTKEENDLGVIFTEKIFYSINCSISCKSANKVIGLIGRNLLNKSEDMMIIIYATLIRPILDYCIPVWKPHYKKNILQLEKIQKYLLKWYQVIKS